MKKYLSTGLLAIVLSFSLILGGCTFQSAMTQLEKFVPIALQAAASIVAILVQAGVLLPGQASVVSTDLAMASASLTDVENAVAAYNAAPASDKNTKLGAVITALQAAQTNLAQGVHDVGLNGSSPAVLAAEAGLQVIITTLAAIEVNLPQPTPAPAFVKANAKKAKFSLIKGNYAGQFKTQFNAAISKYGFANHAI